MSLPHLDYQLAKASLAHKNSGESAPGTAAVATIDASTDRAILVTTVVARYSVATQIGTVTISQTPPGGSETILAVIPVLGSLILPSLTLRGVKGGTVKATLSAGATGVTGNVTIIGYYDFI